MMNPKIITPRTGNDYFSQKRRIFENHENATQKTNKYVILVTESKSEVSFLKFSKFQPF